MVYTYGGNVVLGIWMIGTALRVQALSRVRFRFLIAKGPNPGLASAESVGIENPLSDPDFQESRFPHETQPEIRGYLIGL